MKSFVVITAFVFLASHYLVKVSPQIILEVPGYGVLNGTTESSSDTERPFYAFRSVYYAEMPTPENRFLVSALCIIMYEQQPWQLYILIATGSKISLPDERNPTSYNQ
jgi:hypothetical protein